MSRKSNAGFARDPVLLLLLLMLLLPLAATGERAGARA